MPLLETVKPEDAQGKVKEAYDFFNGMAGMIPLPIQMVSTSPDLLSNLIDTVKYYVNESNLSFSLLAHIRLLVAKEEDYPYCLNLNQTILKDMGGLSQEQVDAVLEDEGQASLEEKEVEMLKFVMKVVKDPAMSEMSDISKLRELGWTDKDIYEAVYEGFLMIIRGMTFKTFKMGE
ncbi:MAG: hypothetical protein GY729_01925 [Desulfobacteraceae bacterium]|nr:hypothetical protein [Desulfobacteraceae bacterium]